MLPIPVQFSSLIPKMLMLTLAISCLTTYNLPCFMDPTFQVPIQNCSLQHQTLLSSPVTSKMGRFFRFGYGPREFIFQCHIFLPSHTVHKCRVQIARRDKKAFPSGQCKEIEEDNKMGKTRELSKKIRDTKRTSHAKIGTTEDRNGMDLTEAEDIKR